MRTTIALLLLLGAQSLFAQGTIRRASSLTNLLQTVDPAAVATGGKVTYLVPGYYDGVNWGGEREITATKESGTTNLYSLWRSPRNTNWFWRATGSTDLDENVMHHGAIGNGVANDTAAIQSAMAAVRAGQRLWSPAGKTFLVNSDVEMTNSFVTIDFSSSVLKSTKAGRGSVLRIGPAQQLLSGLNITLSSITNTFTAPAGTFAPGDMLMLYNSIEDPADYNPGQFAFVDYVDGTTFTLDRFPDRDLQVTNALRFVNAPQGVVVRNLRVDLSAAGNGIGISAYGKGHIVERCYVIGTGTTTDPNYMGIEIRGQSIVARDNYIKGILDAANNSDRSGYGIFLSGDNCAADRNEIHDCKHNLSTSERKAISRELTFSRNRIRQRDDWAALTNAYGAYLFTAAVDVHANVRHVLISYNDIKIGGRYALSLRNGNFDVIGNEVEITQQDGLPFAQQGSVIAEAFVTHGNFVVNRFNCPSNAIHFYFDQADVGISGMHSNLSLTANSFNGGILTFDDMSTTVTNPIVGFTFNGNTAIRTVGTPLLFTSPIHNAILVGNNIVYGAGGNGMSFALPGDDTTYPPREFYIVANTFTRLAGTGVDIRVLSGPTNALELGNNRFYADPPIQGFAGNVSVSRTPKSASSRRQLIEASENELIFNPLTTGNPARYRIGASGMMMGYDSGFTSYRSTASDIAFSTWLPNHSDKYDFSIAGNGQMAWTDGTNNANIVFGPRRLQDIRVGVARLTGAFGMTELLTLGTNLPEGNTINLWVSNANTATIYARTPLGTDIKVSPYSSLPEVANDGNYYSRTYGAWQVLGSMAFVGTAPSDGYTYGLSNQIWVRVATNISAGGISDAPSDGSYYARRNGSWNSLGSMALINDAPSDGFGYVRSNNVWAKAITSGGSGSYSNFWPDLTNALVAGGNVSLTYDTNNNKLTITATGGGGSTNGTSLSVNGTGLAIANLTNTTGITLAVSGSNVLIRLTDRDFGDVTVSSSGTAFTIDNGVITTNKIDAAFHTWVSGKGGLADNNTWSGTNTFSKPIYVDTMYVGLLVVSNIMPVSVGATGTNTHPAEALLVGNTTNAIKHLIAAANRLAGWNSSGVVTGVVAGTGIAINDGVISATGTNAPQVGVNGTSVANPNFTNGPQVSFSVVSSNIQPTIVANSLDTNKIDATFHAALVKDDVGLGTNVIVNNAKVQPAKFTNDPAATGGVIFRTNAAGEILAYATNLPASGGGGLGTNAYVNGVLRQPIKFTNDTATTGGVIFVTNAAGDVTAYATNLPTVTNSPVTRLVRVYGSVLFTVTNNASLGDFKGTPVYSGNVTNITLVGGGATTDPITVELSFSETRANTNYTVMADFESLSAEYGYTHWVEGTNRGLSSVRVTLMSGDGTFNYTGGHVTRLYILDTDAIAGGSGSTTGVTNLSQLDDVALSTPQVNESLNYNGTDWVNGPIQDSLEDGEVWDEAYTSISGGSSQTLPYSTANINSGTSGTTGFANGRGGLFQATSHGSTLYSGAEMNTHVVAIALTNKYKFKAEVQFCATNGVTGGVGFADGLASTNANTDCLWVSVTNGIAQFQASANGTSVLGSGSHVLNTNMWYKIWIKGTNSTAVCTLTTNGVVAFQSAITTSTNIPLGESFVVGSGISMWNLGASTGIRLFLVNEIGHRVNVYAPNR